MDVQVVQPRHRSRQQADGEAEAPDGHEGVHPQARIADGPGKVDRQACSEPVEEFSLDQPCNEVVHVLVRPAKTVVELDAPVFPEDQGGTAGDVDIRIPLPHGHGDQFLELLFQHGGTSFIHCFKLLCRPA
jgi:hypothetical protein